MKKNFLSFIGLLLFIGAIAFNLQMNSSNNQISNVTLKNIEVLTASAEESSTDKKYDAYSCSCFIDGDNTDFNNFVGVSTTCYEDPEGPMDSCIPSSCPPGSWCS